MMDLKTASIIILTYGLCQVSMFTFFKLAKFDDFTFMSLARLALDKYFLLGILCAGAVLVLSFLLVKFAGVSIVLVTLLQFNNIIVNFMLLPLTWRIVFGEQIFSSPDRVWAFVIVLFCALALFYATYLWNKGVP